MKLAAVGVAVLVASLIGDVAAAVVLGGATIATLWAGGRVLFRLVRLADMLTELPKWMLSVTARLEAGHENFEEIRDRLDGLEGKADAAANQTAAVARELDVSVRSD